MHAVALRMASAERCNRSTVRLRPLTRVFPVAGGAAELPGAGGRGGGALPAAGAPALRLSAQKAAAGKQRATFTSALSHAWTYWNAGRAPRILERSLALVTCKEDTSRQCIVLADKQDLLLNVVASAFYYNAGLAMGALRQAGAVQHAFAAWLGGINADGKHFRRLYDKKARLRRLEFLHLLYNPLCVMHELPAAGRPPVEMHPVHHMQPGSAYLLREQRAGSGQHPGGQFASLMRRSKCWGCWQCWPYQTQSCRRRWLLGRMTSSQRSSSCCQPTGNSRCAPPCCFAWRSYCAAVGGFSLPGFSGGFGRQGFCSSSSFDQRIRPDRLLRSSTTAVTPRASRTARSTRTRGRMSTLTRCHSCGARLCSQCSATGRQWWLQAQQPSSVAEWFCIHVAYHLLQTSSRCVAAIQNWMIHGRSMRQSSGTPTAAWRTTRTRAAGARRRTWSASPASASASRCPCLQLFSLQNPEPLLAAPLCHPSQRAACMHCCTKGPTERPQQLDDSQAAVGLWESSC